MALAVVIVLQVVFQIVLGRQGFATLQVFLS